MKSSVVLEEKKGAPFSTKKRKVTFSEETKGRPSFRQLKKKGKFAE